MAEGYELGRRMRSGALWTYLQGGFGTVLQFAAGIALARLLAPADFGVFFAVTAYIAIIGSQVRFGIPEALLQARTVTPDQWNSAFWGMATLALLCTAIVFGIAEWLQNFYGDDRYANVMRLMCINFLVAPYMSINGSLLRRNMNYKAVSQIQLKSTFVSTVTSLTAAMADLGAYSLVIGGISGTLFSTLQMARLAPWRPRLHISLSAVKPLLQYSWRMHLNKTLSQTVQRIDNMLIGKILGIDILGIYARAYSLSRLPIDNICAPLYELIFTAFSRVQDDHEHSVLMYQKVLCAVTSAVFPILIGFIFVADGFIFFVYGEKWLGAAEPMKIMAIGSFAAVITTVTANLASAQNLLSKQTKILLVNLALTITAVIVGARFGLSGIATGIAAKMYVTNALNLRMMQRSHLNIPVAKVWTAITPALLSTAFASAVGTTLHFLLSTVYGPTSVAYVIIEGSAIVCAYGAAWFLMAVRTTDNVALLSNLELIHTATRGLLKGARLKAGLQ